MNKLITSSSNPLIKKIKKILKGDNDYFVIEGENMIVEALNTKQQIEHILEIEGQNKFANSIKISDNVLNSISSTTNPSGCVALIKKTLKELYSSNIIFCDNVQDPGNVGTIIRSAVAFGFDTVYTNVNVYNPKILRSTQGAIFKIKVIKYNDAFSELNSLQNTHQIFISTLTKDAKTIENTVFPTQNKVIVLGNEGHGVQSKLYALKAQKIYIPIEFESLNVAVASGILMYESSRGKNE
ncbi:RNA methyltransferase [Mycoplasmopsis mucosicanis]|uniref:RNA methyltransferase n=1 Tax=Mycoplasmopsis mucosicanis TaxID=458208 RepID=A0A507SMR7_9BACT|nr:RNA methyltransferase [Mycoplasmopsis mucosicanis]TQC51525.1 RNA methyltransferase [Mycoplasmopsis mucosicanis]